MKYNKYSAFLSLILSIVPFVSAIITSFISLPFAEKLSFKLIMIVFFIIIWICLAYFINSLPEKTLQKLKLLEVSIGHMQNYWFVKYEDNSHLSCSIIKICDNCGSDTKSKIRDYNLDLTEKESDLGIVNWEFDGNERLSLLYAAGGSIHSFFRVTYTAGDYDIIRVDDMGNDLPIKTVGKCLKVTPEILKNAGICEDEKLAVKMLKKFKLGKQNYEQLLQYMHKNDNRVFSNKVLDQFKKSQIERLGNPDSNDASVPDKKYINTKNHTGLY